jgi:hypothetical protein
MAAGARVARVACAIIDNFKMGRGKSRAQCGVKACRAII